MSSTTPHLSPNTNPKSSLEAISKGHARILPTEAFNRLARLRRIVVGADDAHGAVQRAATQQLSRSVPTDTEDTPACFVGNYGSGISAFLLLLLLHTETARMDPEILVRVEGADTDYGMKDSNPYVSAHSNRRRRLFRWETTCNTTRLA